jgi:hypothetical protein
MMSPATPYVPSQYQAAKALVEPNSSNAQTAAARTSPASGSDGNSAPGASVASSWVGTLRLEEEHATISIRVFPAGQTRRDSTRRRTGSIQRWQF